MYEYYFKKKKKGENKNVKLFWNAILINLNFEIP